MRSIMTKKDESPLKGLASFWSGAPTFKALGHAVGARWDLETFLRPSKVYEVLLVSDEVTAVCPVTGQPDQYTVTISYSPKNFCIESKSLKLYLQSFRNEGVFCEALTSQIAQDIYEVVNPYDVVVIVKQKSRGGVSITARAMIPELDAYEDGEEIDGNT